MNDAKGMGCVVLIVAALLLGAIGFFSGVAMVDAGEACVIKQGGQIQRVENPGFHWKKPFLEKMVCYSTRSVVYEVVNDPNSSESEADYVDFLVDGVTIDGQPITITYTIRYRINADNLSMIHEDVAINMDQVNERVIKFHSRPIVRQILNTHTAEELYLGGLDTISTEIFDQLAPRFASSGVTLEYFEIKRPGFSEEYTQAIENKQLEIERAEAEKNRLETERQTTAVEREKAERQAEIRRINAQADADVIALEGEALRQNPEVLELRRIEALENADYMIVPDSSMPIITVPTPEAKDGE